MDAGAVIIFGEDDIRRDQESRAPRGRAGLMHAGAQGGVDWPHKMRFILQESLQRLDSWRIFL